MKTLEGRPAYRASAPSNCFCKKLNSDHQRDPADPAFGILCTGGRVLLNELAMINTSMEICDRDITDVEMYGFILELEGRGVSKARLKSRLRKTMDRIDKVYEEKPQRRKR